MAKKWYVVWNGRFPGVYDSWEECQAQIEGYPQAKYKGFTDERIALEAYEDGWNAYRNRVDESTPHGSKAGLHSRPIANSISVDGACSGNPGPMEYRGVHTYSKSPIFHKGDLFGTNNIGEFLAIVHALAWQKQQGIEMPIYSDSRTAMAWVRNGKCKTKLPINAKTEKTHELIVRAENWLTTHRVWIESHKASIPILKWNTEDWGEIPADFGRK